MQPGIPTSEPLKYLSIDSLCIIQDSVEDWDRESAMMCSNYENAILTIALASGTERCYYEAGVVFKGFNMTKPQPPSKSQETTYALLHRRLRRICV